MNDNREPRWWSWKNIVEHADRLGIPHFQRGAVWDASNRVALLESLYEQSPCGSFVLWSPKDQEDSQEHGVPIRAFAKNASPMWLVDGQQRTRAMLDTFEQLLLVPKGANGWALVPEVELDELSSLDKTPPADRAEDDAEGTDDDEDDVHFWGVVLPAMRTFDGVFGNASESRRVLRGSAFRQLGPRARTQLNSEGKERPVPPLPVGVIPLATLLSRKSVFHDASRNKAAKIALESFKSARADLQGLDELLPWGPQFLTGYAYTRVKGVRKATRWHSIDPEKEKLVDVLVALFTTEWIPVWSRFKGMLDGPRFALGWLPPDNVSAAIDAYVRINRAGVRVRVEERALALLSRARPSLLDDLEKFVKARDGDDGERNQRALLAHESDRQLSFGVWMTTVTRYTTLALLGSYSRRWLGTTAIDKETFGYRLDRVGPGETGPGKKTWARLDYETPNDLVRECAAQATSTLVLVDSVLSKKLWLDHRMARPSLRALTPLIDLLYRVPHPALANLHKDEGFRDAIARLLLWAFLGPYIDQPDLEQLVIDVHGIDETAVGIDNSSLSPWGVEATEQELRRAFVRYQSGLLAIWRRKHGEGAAQQDQPVSEALTALALETFRADVREARSLQHPAVGWLYAIERRGGAKEFLWQAQVEGYESSRKFGVPRQKNGLLEEVPLSAAKGKEAETLYPEKQHIVPFSVARTIVGKGGTRATASPANAIGNLTWLSSRQNGFVVGFADRWAVMDSDRDRANLVARGMFSASSAAGSERIALDDYQELKAIDPLQDERDSAQKLFDAFCDARAKWLVEQMEEWLKEPLSEEAKKWLPG